MFLCYEFDYFLIYFVVCKMYVVVGGSFKILMIVNICLDVFCLFEILLSFNFFFRVRSVVLSFGNRDIIKKWRDIVSDFLFY